MGPRQFGPQRPRRPTSRQTDRSTTAPPSTFTLDIESASTARYSLYSYGRYSLYSYGAIQTATVPWVWRWMGGYRRVGSWMAARWGGPRRSWAMGTCASDSSIAEICSSSRWISRALPLESTLASVDMHADARIDMRSKAFITEYRRVCTRWRQRRRWPMAEPCETASAMADGRAMPRQTAQAAVTAIRPCQAPRRRL